jgi:proteasome accessory factor B
MMTRRAELSPAEIAALALSLAHLGAGPQATVARRALSHLLAELPGLSEMDDVITATLTTLIAPLDEETAGRARVLASAITERLIVRLHYADAAGHLTTREVEPVTCLVHRDHWYLVAWCRLRHGIRAFRFDRVIAVEPTTHQARPHRPNHYLPFQPRRPLTRAA